MLNQQRMAKAREALGFARSLRTGTIPIVKWRGWAAQALIVAGEERRAARLPWDYTCAIWVCRCCILSHANGECCDSDEHGGDSMEPLSAIKAADSVAMGGEHNERCTEADREAGCDCEEKTFSSSQCDGCGSWLAGTRHAMTLFVNERRNSVSV